MLMRKWEILQANAGFRIKQRRGEKEMSNWSAELMRPNRDRVLNPRDAIIKFTSTGICGSDIHVYNGFITTA